jgi:hypothetical protein
VPPTEETLARVWIIIVQDMSDTFSPDRTDPSSDLDADTRISEEVAHVAGLVAVFGDDPERVAHQSIPHWRSPGLTGPTAGGFD